MLCKQWSHSRVFVTNCTAAENKCFSPFRKLFCDVWDLGFKDIRTSVSHVMMSEVSEVGRICERRYNCFIHHVCHRCV